MKNKIEILAPAKDLEGLIAAVNGHADAVYLGLKNFSARKAAKNFTIEELKEALEITKKLGVKIYVACNTLVKNEEFDSLIEMIDQAYLLGVDAFICQDYGLINYINERYTDAIIHISTQVNVTNYLEALHFKSIGATRVVLARELTYQEIKKIKEKAEIETEAFIHGAICVSYSGNCFFSKSIGNRSGNRGDCAQICRKKFSLLKEDETLDSNYLISPKDMSNLNDFEKYQLANIDSLKIEGRLKSSAYTHYVTKSLYQKINFGEEVDYQKLKRLYNRDFTPGFIDGTRDIINKNTNNHQGVYLGKVTGINPKFIKIKLEDELSVGSGIRILSGEEYGFNVSAIFKDKQSVKIANKGDEIQIFNDGYFVQNNDVVLLTKDFQLEKIEKTIDIKRQINLEFSAKEGLMTFSYQNISVSSNAVFTAKNMPNTVEDINNILTKTGKTYYDFNIKYDISNNLYINNKELKNLKLQMIDRLDELFLVNQRKIKETKKLEIVNKKDPEITYYFIVETKEQLELVKDYDNSVIIIRNEELYLSEENDEYFFFSDRIITNPNLNIKNKLMTSDYTYIDQNKELIASSYMNVYNDLSANYLFKKGYKMVSLSHEFTIGDLLEFDATNRHLGIHLYGKIDVMIMKTCPISNHYQTPLKCNLCKNNNFYLEDQYNNSYPLKEEQNCNIRIINHKTTDYTRAIKDFKKRGFSDFIISFTNENRLEVLNLLSKLGE